MSFCIGVDLGGTNIAVGIVDLKQKRIVRKASTKTNAPRPCEDISADIVRLCRELCDNVDLTGFYMAKGDIEKVKNLDSEFHDIIYRCCESRMLGKTLSELHRYIASYRKLSLAASGRIDRSLAEHKEIYDAISNGNADAADALMSEHVERALENLLKIINNNEKDK